MMRPNAPRKRRFADSLIADAARYTVEHLDQRILLAGIHDPDLINRLALTLQNRFNSFSEFANPLGRFNETSLLSQNIAMVGSGVGQSTHARNKIDSLLSRIGGGYATFADLKNALEGASGIGDGVQVLSSTDQTDILTMTVRFVASETSTTPMGSTFGSVDFPTSGMVTLQTTYDFTVNMGTFWQDNSVGAVFFLDSATDSFDVHTVATSNSITASRLGFVDVTLSNPTVTLSPDFVIDLKDPGGDGVVPGRVTLSELNNATTAQLFSATVTSGPTGFSATVSTSGAVGLAAANVQFNWVRVTDVTPSSDNLASLGAYNGLAHIGKGTITGGMSDFAGFADRASFVTFGRPAPISGDEIGGLVDLPGLLRDRFVTNAGNYSTIESFATRLTQLSGISNSSFALSGNQLTFKLNVAQSVNAFVPLQLGLGQVDLRLDGSAIRLFADLTGSLKFGVDLSTDKFFVAADSDSHFQVNASVNTSGINAAGAIGFIAATVANGSANLSAIETMDLTDAADDRIDGDDLTSAGGYTTRVKSTLTGSASATLPITVPLVGLPQTTLNFSWTDLTNSSTVAANTQDFAALNAYSMVTADSFANGIDGMINLLEDAAEDLSPANPLNTTLPIVNESLQQLIDVPTQLGNISGATRDANNDLTFRNTTDLLSVLSGINGVGSGNASFSLLGDAIEYTFHLHKTLLNTLPVNLGLTSQADLSVSGSATATMNLDVNLTFGVRSDGTFYIATTPGASLATSGSLSLAMDPAGRFGFLGITVGAASASFNPNAAITLIDPVPATPNRILFTEVDSNQQTTYSSRSLTGAASVTLPLTTGVSGVAPGNLVINWSNLTGAVPAVDTSGVSQMAAFQNVSPGHATDGLNKLPSLLDVLSSGNGFGKELPLIGGNLRSLLAPGNQIRNMIPHIGDFKTAQGLQLGLQQAFAATGINLTVTLSASGTDLHYTLTLPQTIGNQNLAFKIGENVAGFGFNTSGNVLVNGTVTTSLGLGLNAATGVSAADRFYVDPASTSSTLAFKVTGTVSPSATFGYFNVNVASGTINIAGATGGAVDTSKNATLTIPFQDADGRITGSDITANPASFIGTPTSDPNGIAARASLPISGLPSPGSTPHVDFAWSNLLAGTAPTITPSNLGDLTSLNNWSFPSVQQGINAVKNLISSLLNNAAMNTTIPFLNQRLKDLFDFAAEANQFWNGLTSGSSPTAFDSLVHSVATSLGASWNIQNVSASQPLGGGLPDNDPASGRLRYLLTYDKTIPLADSRFDMGVSFLSLDGNLQSSLHYTFSIGFGVNPNDGFYLTDESLFNLSANVTGALDQVGGTISGLKYGVHGGAANINFNLNAPLHDTNSDHKIPLGDLTGNLATVVTPAVSGTGAVVLPLGVIIGDGGPGVKTTFRAYWDSSQPTSFFYSKVDRGSTPITQLSTNLTDAFSAAEFELGDFLQGLLSPILSTVSQYTPLLPQILEVLNYDIPIIGKPIDLLGLELGPAANDALKLLSAIDLVLNALPPDGSTLDLSAYFPSSSGPLGGASLTPGPGSTDGGNVTTAMRDFLRSLHDDYDIQLFGLNPDDLGGSLSNAVANILAGNDVDLIRWNPAPFQIRWDPPVTDAVIAASPFPFGYVYITEHLHGGFGFFADADFGLSTRGLLHPSNPGHPNLLDGFFFGDNIDEFGQDQPEIGFEGDVGVGVTGHVVFLGLAGGRLTANGDFVVTIGADFADVKEDLNNPPTNKNRVGFNEPGGDDHVYLDEINFLASNYGVTCTITPVGKVSLQVGGEIALELLGFFPIAPIPFTLFDLTLFDFEFVSCHAEQKDLATYSSTSQALSTNPDPTNRNYLNHNYRIELLRDKNGDPSDVRISINENGRQPTLIDNLDTPHIADQDFFQLLNGSTPPPTDLFGNDLDTGVVAKDVTDDQRYVLNQVRDPQTGIKYYAWAPTDADVTMYNLQDAEAAVEDFSLVNAADPNFIGPLTQLDIGGSEGDDEYYIDPDVLRSINRASGPAISITTLNISSGGGDETIRLDNFVPDDTTLTNISVDGGSGNDSIVGSNKSEFLTGGGGEDTISGNGGDDVIFGGAGNDQLSGGLGNDKAFGQTGNDLVLGIAGNNTLSGDQGTDTVLGGVGNDSIDGGDDPDAIAGGAGTDQITGGAGDDSIDGGEGNDFIYGNAGNDSINAAEGDDFIQPDDTVTGPGSDTVLGGPGTDLLHEEVNGGNIVLHDTTVNGQGNDTFTDVERVDLIGAANTDVTAWSRGAVNISSNNGAISDANDTDYLLTDSSLARGSAFFSLSGITTAHLTGGGRTNHFDISGWSGGGSIDGGGGRDTIIARSGNWTLSDSIITGGRGANLALASIEFAQITGSEAADSIDASGFSGQVTLFGAGGNDSLTGGTGDDSIDGGAGADCIAGEAGDDLLTGGGNGDSIAGGAGDDVIHGSEDAADSLDGNAGRDQIYGGGGNDSIDGGDDADTVQGQAGDDTLAGGEGSDFLVGGANHDVLYGHNSTGASDDNAVDYLYGDFSTNQNEPDSGNDRLDGNGGYDLLFGEGGDDFIADFSTPGYKDIIDFGAGEGANLNDFTTPTATAPPSLQSATFDYDPATLPTGPMGRERWSELAGSASGLGISGGNFTSTEPSTVAGASGHYIAWADNRTGNFEIYVARFDGTNWVELAGSAHGTGISNTPADSRRPSITLDGNGNPVVAWTEVSGASKSIRVAQFNGTAWANLGTQPASGAAVADNAQIVYRANVPLLAYIQQGPVSNVIVEQLNVNDWLAFGGGNATNASASVTHFSLATDGTNVAVAWSDVNSNSFAVQSSGGGFSALAGLADNYTAPQHPSAAYFGGTLFVAFDGLNNGDKTIAVKRYSGGWTDVSSGLLVKSSAPAEPQLSSNGGALNLAWLEDELADHTGISTAIYARKWNGASFVEQLTGDASLTGIHGRYSLPTNLSLTTDPSGNPIVAWGDRAPGTESIYLRTNPTPVGSVYYVNDDSVAGDYFATAPGNNAANGLSPHSPKQTLQALLDAYTLGPNDVILLDSGRYDAIDDNVTNITIGGDETGARIIGAPGLQSHIAGPLTIAAPNVVLQGVSVDAGVTVNAAQTTLYQDRLSGGLANKIVGYAVTASGASDLQMVGNLVADSSDGISLINSDRPMIIDNTLNASGGYNLALASSVNGIIRSNQIAGAGTGILIGGGVSGEISGNDIAAANIGLDLDAAFSGPIRGNRIHGAGIGVIYTAAANLSGNLIYDNGQGVYSTVNSITDGLGYVAGSQSNRIFGNGTGITLANGTARAQIVYDNTTGLAGQGTLGATLDDANSIEHNVTGIDFAGTVQYQKVGYNTTGIVSGGNLVQHNIVYRNVQAGISVSGTNSRIYNNTVYSITGDALNISGAGAEVRNNMLWARGGYAMDVGNSARAGFFSDYNDLYATDTGKPVFFLKAFDDLIDWQRDVNRYDLHSIGATQVDPARARPQFNSPAGNDLTIAPQLGGQRVSSPTIDAGDILSDFAVSRTTTNLLTNPSFESGAAGWSFSAGAGVASGAAWDGSSYFFGGNNVAASVEQTVNLTGNYTATQLDSQDLVAVAGGRFKSAAESPLDTGKLVISFLSAGGSTIGTPTTVSLVAVSDRWNLDGSRIDIPVGTRQIKYRFDATRNSGSTDDAFLDSAFVRIESENFGVSQGAQGNTSYDDSPPPAPRISIRNPDMYQDLIVTQPITVRWDSYGNTADRNVQLDLYQDTANGPQFLTTITSNTPDTGSFTFIPANLGIATGTHGLRVQATLIGDTRTLDRSIESSTVPESGNSYYIDDRSDTGDQYTPAAIGNNRNTGKLPTAPKPLLTTLFRVYDLGPGDTVSVDQGTYQHFDPLVISGNAFFGDDQGVTITGPTNVGSSATISTIGNPAGPMIDINQGSFNTISHLTLTGPSDYGMWLHNASTNNSLSFITQSNAALDGIRVESDSAPVTLDHLDISANGRDGASIAPTIGGVSDSKFYNNPNGWGLNLTSAAAGATFEANQVFSNKQGVYINSTSSTTPATFGSPTLAPGRGNRVTGNGFYGIYAEGNVQIAGNTVSGATANFNSYGILATNNNIPINKNVVFANRVGISGGNVNNNRVYGNTQIGIAFHGTATGNVIYNNGTGLFADWAPNVNGPGPFAFNNLIYGNSAAGFVLNGGKSDDIANNTIYQTNGDAIQWNDSGGNGAVDVRFRDNVLHVGGSGYAIDAAAAVQNALISDYNLFYTTGSAKVGFYSGLGRTTLSDWRLASGRDKNSRSGDPMYLNPAGADGIMGYASGVDHGSDDNFHEISQTGSFKGGSLAPAYDPLSGLPINQTGSFSPDMNSGFSPVIDHGDPTVAFTNEPQPNGAFVNIGAYGNTAQASESPGTFLEVDKPEAGDTWLTRQTFNIAWRDEAIGTGTATIKLVHNDGNTIVEDATIAAGAPNSGSFSWNIPDTLAARSDYQITVTRDDISATAFSGVFSIQIGTPIYYVNDAGPLEAGDITTAIGDDANDGLSPATPKATIQGVLDAYDLNLGDVIQVDRGTYTLTNNINVSHDDAGVTIQGFTGLSNSDQWSTSVLADAPTHYYRFGESSGVSATDSSGHGNNATYQNGVALGAAGALDRDTDTAASFDGVNDYVQLPPGFQNFPNGFSFEEWVYPRTNAPWQRIFDIGNGSTNNPSNDIEIYRSGSSNTLGFFVRNGTSSSGGEVLASNVLTPNQWTHIAVTMTATGAATIYKNGVAVASGNVNVPNDVVRMNGYMGRSPFTADSYFDGQMDEAAFYDKVLTPTQIATRYSLSRKDSIIDRNNGATNQANFQLNDADNVTIKNFRLTGGYNAVLAASGSDSDNVILDSNEIYGTAWNGIDVGTGNDNWTISNNNLHNVGGRGIEFNTSGGLISSNTLTAIQSHGIEISGPNTVSNNTITGEVSGDAISASYSASSGPRLVIDGNTIHDNADKGVQTFGGAVTVSNNTIYNQNKGSIDFFAGVYTNGAALVIGNTLYNNGTGVAGSGGIIRNNRIYSNLNNGITGVGSTEISGNFVYNNAQYGIYSFNSASPVFNNVSYANGAGGIAIDGGNNQAVYNNTIDQPSGNGIATIFQTTNNTSLRNNIIQVGNGVALNFGTNTQPALSSDYNLVYITGTGNFGTVGGQTFATRNDMFFAAGFDQHSLATDPKFVDPDGADDILGYSGGVDHGQDDNFTLQSASPAIDAGDPGSYYYLEPQPNGARVNSGYTGDTALANTSPAKTIHVIQPNGLEKLSVGSPYTINFASTGIGQAQPILYMNAGGSTVGPWSAQALLTSSFFDQRTINQPIDVSGVTDPAPQQVYQQVIRGNNNLEYVLPLPDGTYGVRLHFMEPDATAPNQRLQDIQLNGTTVTSNYDIFAVAGARYKATTLSYSNVAATGGAGIKLDLILKSGFSSILSGIEVFAANPSGSATPTANIDVSYDGGANWNSVATNVAMNAQGFGSYTWTPDTASENALIRVTDTASPTADQSDSAFVIGGTGHDYYLNDGSTAGDAFTTAVGSDSNSGKSPDKPMRSLEALIDAYHLTSADTIHVDTGTYSLTSSINLTGDDSGVTITGPAGAGSPTAVFSRTNNSSQVFWLNGASNVTFNRLGISGGSVGVYAHFDSNFPSAISSNPTITNCEIYGNGSGIDLFGSGGGATITGNLIRNNGTSLNMRPAGGRDVYTGTITGNTVRDNTGAFSFNGSIGDVSNNFYFNNGGSNSRSFNVSSNFIDSPPPLVTMRNNDIHDNTPQGFAVSLGGNVIAENNLVHDNVGAGFEAGGAGVFIHSNTIYKNTTDGIDMGSSIADGNRIFGNGGIGISLSNSAIARNNIVYSNNRGISLTNGNLFYTSGTVTNNLVYANTLYGILESGGGPSNSGPSITNNTVYQPTGNGIQINSTAGVFIQNNVIVAGGNAAETFSGVAPSGLTIDYNVVQLTGSAVFGKFDAGIYPTQNDWYADFGWDHHSIIADPQFVDPDGADNALGYSGGVDHGADDDFAVPITSPTIDAGDPTFAFANEPSPNGGRINAGHTGNTAIATVSAAQLIQVLEPTGLDRQERDNTLNVKWRSAGISGTVDLALVDTNGSVVATIGNGITNNGAFNWTIPGSVPEGNYRVRVQSSSTPNVSGQSNGLFALTNGGHDFYVNDSSAVNDFFTSALGSNANTGKSPDQPLRTISAVLNLYDLEPGDVIHVDSGTYTLGFNLQLFPQDSGVRIEGPQGGAGQATIDRNVRSNAVNSVFEFDGADNITFDRLLIRKGFAGFYAGFGADSDGITISRCDITGQYSSGIYFANGDENWTITGNTVHDEPATGDGGGYGIISEQAGSSTISNNTIFNMGVDGINVSVSPSTTMVQGNTVFGITRTGISVAGQANATGVGPTVLNNIVHDNTTGILLAASGPSVAATARGNEVYLNGTGIRADDLSTVEGNRVYRNTSVGIVGNEGATIQNNQVFNNAVGVQLGRDPTFGGFSGQVFSNLVYANTTRAIWSTNSSNARFWNNTVYSIVGDGLRFEGSSNESVRNNILWVEAGSGIFVASNAQSGFSSDRNIFFGAGQVGTWGSTNASTLASWQTASAGDASSIQADPKFIDKDGADNILGFQTSPPVDGSRDDNFFLNSLSPAIDHGDSVGLSRLDFDSLPRRDDPGTANTGSSDYSFTTGANQFSTTGTAQNFRYFENGTWNLNLPFSFPFYGKTYTSVTLGDSGIIQLGGNTIAGDPANSTAKLIANTVIAPMWDSIRTNFAADDDIDVDTSVTGQVKIRWNGTATVNNSDVNFDVVLFSDGRIRFDYGAGNSTLTPTVGISAGNGQAYQILSYDGASSLTNAASLSATLVPGVADIGAFEFRGDSTDSIPPTITSTLPAPIHSSGSVNGPLTSITLNTSEPLNRFDAAASANYELRGAGPDGVLDTADDVFFTLSPSYVDGTSSVTLNVTGTPPLAGLTRLIVFTNTFTSNGPHDLSGLLLDGDANGTAGGNYVRTFNIAGDTTAPGITAATFSYITNKPRLTVQFSEDVSASLAAGDFEITDTATSQLLDSSKTTVAWNASTNTATLTFDGFSDALIPDGSYHLLIRKTNVADLSGNLLQTDGTLDFFFLEGDADHSAAVNALDFNALASNYGKASATFADADFNYDGQVNTLDFTIMARNFGTHLVITMPASPSVAGSPASSLSPFSTGPSFPDDRPLVQDVLK